MSSNPSRALLIFIIVCGCFISMVSFGVRGSFGLFLQPMSTDLGWGREIFAFAIALQNLIWGAAQPVAGAIADRYGSARVLIAGGIAYALGTYLMSVSSTPLAFHLSAGVLVGLGVSGLSFAIVIAAFGRMVPEEKRSMVFGIGTSAGSVGQFLIAPLGQAFIEAYGWGTALVLLSVVVALVIPLAFPLRGKGTVSGPEQSIREALAEAKRHSGFLLLTAGFFVCGFHVAFIQTHLPAYIVDSGVDARYGAWAIAVVGLVNVFGALASGYLGGKYSKKYLLSALYVARAVVIAVFVMVPATPVTVIVFAAAMGLLWLSTVPLTSALVAQIFGPRYMGMLFGIVFFGHQLGASLGVWLGGYLYDRTGSYDVVWWVAVALGLASALIHWPIDERRIERVAEA